MAFRDPKRQAEREAAFKKRFSRALQTLIDEWHEMRAKSDDRIQFVLPRWHSKKNGRVGHRPKEVALWAQKALQDTLSALCKGETLWDQEDVSVVLNVFPETDEVLVSIWYSNPRPNKQTRTGRTYDLVNLFDVICDAIQAKDGGGGIIRDDCQVSQALVTRHYKMTPKDLIALAEEEDADAPGW